MSNYYFSKFFIMPISLWTLMPSMHIWSYSSLFFILFHCFLFVIQVGQFPVLYFQVYSIFPFLLKWIFCPPQMRKWSLNHIVVILETIIWPQKKQSRSKNFIIIEILFQGFNFDWRDSGELFLCHSLFPTFLSLPNGERQCQNKAKVRIYVFRKASSETESTGICILTSKPHCFVTLALGL